MPDPRYAGHPQTGAPPGPVARPQVLTIGTALALAAGLLTVVAQILSLATGKDAVAKKLGVPVDVYKAAGAPGFDTLQSRAYLGIVVAVVVIVLAVLARGASMGIRVALAVFLGIGAALMLRSVTDIFPAASKGLGWIAILAALAAIVTLFMPAVNQYKAATKR